MLSTRFADVHVHAHARACTCTCANALRTISASHWQHLLGQIARIEGEERSSGWRKYYFADHLPKRLAGHGYTQLKLAEHGSKRISNSRTNLAWTITRADSSQRCAILRYGRGWHSRMCSIDACPVIYGGGKNSSQCNGSTTAAITASGTPHFPAAASSD